MNIISVDSKDIVDITEIQEQLTRNKLQYLFSDFRFCPYIVSYKNPETSSIEIMNVNDGFYEHLKKTHNVIIYSDIDDFIYNVIALKNGGLLSNSLF